jgi:hypothetical protein
MPASRNALGAGDGRPPTRRIPPACGELRAMLASLHFLSEQVFGDSYLELLTLAVLVSAFATAYKHIECHRSGCHRLGRFTHGHLKLCARHHPLVPDNGRITSVEIDAATSAMAPGRDGATTPAPHAKH